MSAAEQSFGELCETAEFFAPVSSDLVDSLIGRYQSQRALIENFHETYTSQQLSGIISYFCRRDEDRMPGFDIDSALCALNADYWAEALSLTDVYEAMPQKRRDSWNDQMQAWRKSGYKKGKNPEMDLPDFTESVVRATLTSLIADRSKFFAERVDGIFRELSGEHVTNRPEGFGKRMIMYVLDSYSTTSWRKCGHLTDLRNVIAKFMGRSDVARGSTDVIVKAALQKHGEWQSIDGGAMRIRVYLKGTAHLEVHPDMAWKLNCVLASIYPSAIPASFRIKPKRKVKEFTLFDKIISPQVLNLLVSARPGYEKTDNWRQEYRAIPRSISFSRTTDADKHLLAEAGRILEAIGGTRIGNSKWGQ